MTTPPSVTQVFDQHGGLATTLAGRVTHSNPPFDPRRYSTNPYYAEVQQGLLIRTHNSTFVDAGSTGSSNDPSATGGSSASQLTTNIPDSVMLRFLYNPSDLQEAFSPDPSIMPGSVNTGDATDPASTASLVSATSTQISFDLLFDRVYEANNEFNTPGDLTMFSHLSGVQIDMLYLKALMGIPFNGQGMAQLLPTYLYLGGASAPSFYGVISSASIAYTHFTPKMVPLRAAVSIGMTQWINTGDRDPLGIINPGDIAKPGGTGTSKSGSRPGGGGSGYNVPTGGSPTASKGSSAPRVGTTGGG